MPSSKNGNLFITDKTPVYLNSDTVLAEYFTISKGNNADSYNLNTANNSITIKSNNNGSGSSSTTYVEFTTKDDFIFSCTLTFNYPTNNNRGAVYLYLNNITIGTYNPAYQKQSTYHTANITMQLKRGDKLKFGVNYSSATVVLSHMFINAPNPYYRPKIVQNDSPIDVFTAYYADSGDSSIKTTLTGTYQNTQDAYITAVRNGEYRAKNNHIYHLYHDELDRLIMWGTLDPACQSRQIIRGPYGVNSTHANGGSVNTADDYAWEYFYYSLSLMSPIMGDYDFEYEIVERPIVNITAGTAITDFNVAMKNTSNVDSSSHAATNVTSYKKSVPYNYTYEITPNPMEGYSASVLTGIVTEPLKETLTGTPIRFPVNIIYSGNTTQGQVLVQENDGNEANLTKKQGSTTTTFKSIGQYEAGPKLVLKKLWGSNGSATYQPIYSTDGVKGGNITGETYPSISYELNIDLYKPRVIILFTTTDTNQYYNVVYGTNQENGLSGWDDAAKHCPYTQKMLAFNLPTGTTSFTLSQIKSYSSATSTSGAVAHGIYKTYSVSSGKATVIDLGAIA